MVRGYHEYRSVWPAVVGEELQCRVEPSNPHDLFAVAVCTESDGVVVGFELFSTRETIDSTSLLTALMEDDGTISERGPLGRGRVDRIICRLEIAI